MIADPDRYAGRYAEAGADYAIVHVETSRNLPRMFGSGGGRPGLSVARGRQQRLG
jgi:hypothetical protein